MVATILGGERCALRMLGEKRGGRHDEEGNGDDMTAEVVKSCEASDQSPRPERQLSVSCSREESRQSTQ